MRRAPRSTLFPYTTLFRSSSAKRSIPGAGARGAATAEGRSGVAGAGLAVGWPAALGTVGCAPVTWVAGGFAGEAGAAAAGRSEEHTSELQSLTNLVCRLLLDAPSTEIYTLSLHDALPIFERQEVDPRGGSPRSRDRGGPLRRCRRRARRGLARGVGHRRLRAGHLGRRRVRGRGGSGGCRQIGRAHV